MRKHPVKSGGSAKLGAMCAGREACVMVNDAQRAVQQFADDLKDLRTYAGMPSFERMSILSKRQDAGSEVKAIPLPNSTASDAIRGKRLPSAATVLAFVGACRRAATEDGLIVDPARFDPVLWHRGWARTRVLRDASTTEGTSTVNALADAVSSSDSVLPAADEASESERSRFVRELTAHIEQSGENYSREIQQIRALPPPRRSHEEAIKLEAALDDLSLLLDEYIPPPSPQPRNTLTFANTYFEAASVGAVEALSRDPDIDLVAAVRARESKAHDPPKALVGYLTALLAAEVEFRASQLTYTQKVLLANVYERIGTSMLVEFELYIHAMFALNRAIVLYRQTDDFDAQDRCGLSSARARHKTLPPGLRRAVSSALDLLCCYGYRPFRMLGWLALQIVASTLALRIVTDISTSLVLYTGIANCFSPLGLGDLAGFGQGARAILVTESSLGTLTVLLFVVFLSRRIVQVR
ncbi:hypothetical protein GFY24_27985 [Nocardia sp. SYP-A9097]|uniref:hypothetical protein n=1 Tax=Nocardia sp. SYP-A9097 TaxID=2663237 RepID=UPI00129BF037|nr:hypothetical protein [Nocardia sp. SYP-A9097]MRH91236.1 hypothetical protein [Nocardia sp. SYP-A9097]